MNLKGTIWRHKHVGRRFRLERSLDGAEYVTGHHLKPGTNTNGRPVSLERNHVTGGPRDYVLEEPNVQR